MAAAGGGGSARQQPVRKYQKENKKTGKQSTRAGCDGSCRRGGGARQWPVRKY